MRWLAEWLCLCQRHHRRERTELHLCRIPAAARRRCGVGGAVGRERAREEPHSHLFAESAHDRPPARAGLRPREQAFRQGGPPLLLLRHQRHRWQRRHVAERSHLSPALPALEAHGGRDPSVSVRCRRHPRCRHSHFYYHRVHRGHQQQIPAEDAALATALGQLQSVCGCTPSAATVRARCGQPSRQPSDAAHSLAACRQPAIASREQLPRQLRDRSQ